MILFLDFDGVLHPDAVYLVRGRPVLKGEGSLFMWAPKLIEALDPYQEVNIVLSTSWVRHLGFTKAKNRLPQSLAKRVIGATWHSAMLQTDEDGYLANQSWYDQATRYGQIARYVSRAKLSHEQWLAIDDDVAGWPEALRDRLIATDGETGLSPPNKIAALQQKLHNLAKPPC
jgi:hypothetical protein